jgi:hypothetical protein
VSRTVQSSAVKVWLTLGGPRGKRGSRKRRIDHPAAPRATGRAAEAPVGRPPTGSPSTPPRHPARGAGDDLP